MNPAGACALALVLLAAAAAPSLAKPADSFAAACVARGTREAACNCQARLARQTFDARERRIATQALSGATDAARKELAALGEAKAKAFAGKMQALGRRAAAECR